MFQLFRMGHGAMAAGTGVFAGELNCAGDFFQHQIAYVGWKKMKIVNFAKFLIISEP